MGTGKRVRIAGVLNSAGTMERNQANGSSVNNGHGVQLLSMLRIV